MSPAILSIGAVLVVSGVSLSGVVLLGLGEVRIRRWMAIFVGFSTGALLGNVLLHMLPEMTESGIEFRTSMLLMIGGIVASFVIEKMIHWHHCHHIDHDHAHVHPVGHLTLIGDGLHNIVDGLLIAAAFLADVRLGVATSIAVALHEIPQEIGDFSILLHSGFKRSTALLLNGLSALTAVGGALIVILTQNAFPNITDWILPFAAGNLLYIAGVDLLPELHKDARLKQSTQQLIALLAGIGLLYSLTTFAEHEHHEANREDIHVSESIR